MKQYGKVNVGGTTYRIIRDLLANRHQFRVYEETHDWRGEHKVLAARYDTLYEALIYIACVADNYEKTKGGRNG